MISFPRCRRSATTQGMTCIYIYVWVISLTLEGIKAEMISTSKMAMGSKSKRKGGGGNGGSRSGSISKEAVKHDSKSNDSKLK